MLFFDVFDIHRKFLHRAKDGNVAVCQSDLQRSVQRNAVGIELLHTFAVVLLKEIILSSFKSKIKSVNAFCGGSAEDRCFHFVTSFHLIFGFRKKQAGRARLIGRRIKNMIIKECFSNSRMTLYLNTECTFGWGIQDRIRRFRGERNSLSEHDYRNSPIAREVRRGIHYNRDKNCRLS